jgi:signal transduction histidine kinase
LRGLLLAASVLAVVACAPHPRATSAATVVLDHAEAAPSDWDAAAPPATGWVPVTLTDDWSARWPRHDGVVWYRLRWNQADAGTPVGLLLDYVCLADAVYVNGSLVHRDASLREPLSRSWVRPQYVLLDAPLLREGENTLLVRVSGLAAYQPGLGTVHVGDPATLQAQYRRDTWGRYHMQWFDQAVSFVLGGLFAMLWLFRRREAVYGWFALSTVLAALYGLNYVAMSPWPFAGTDAWEAFNAVLYLASAVGFAVFLLRYAGRRWRLVERLLWFAVLIGFIAAALAPTATGENRDYWICLGGVVNYLAVIMFVVHAVRSGHADRRVLAACLSVGALVSVHDFLLFYGIVNGDTYLLALTSPLILIGMGFVLAYRFAAAMRRIEGFNVELSDKVDAATGQIRTSLAREHALELSHTRIGERLNLVRDLHDGFGGSLLEAISRLERDSSPGATEATATLKALRDDLRLVIDTTTQTQDMDLAELLAPLRHRWTQRLELAGIEARWQVAGLDGVHLGTARSLDLLRFLQEALTNVFKHSCSMTAEVTVSCDGERLRLQVSDAGRGFDPSANAPGAGMSSLRARATRLGAAFDVRSVPGAGTSVSLDLSF